MAALRRQGLLGCSSCSGRTPCGTLACPCGPPTAGVLLEWRPWGAVEGVGGRASFVSHASQRLLAFRGGSAPRARRSRCCRHSPWRSSVARTPPAWRPLAVCGLPAAACPPGRCHCHCHRRRRRCPSPGLLPASPCWASLALEGVASYPPKHARASFWG